MPCPRRPGHAAPSRPCEGADSSVAFTATAVPGNPARVVALSGDQQPGVVGEPLPMSYEVSVTDAHGNDTHVDFDELWEVTLGDGALLVGCDGCGPMSPRHVLGRTEGLNEATATVGSAQVTFRSIGVTALVGLVRVCGRGCGPARFTPDSVSVALDQTVGWTWSGAHELAFDDGWAPPPGGPHPSGYLRTFTAPGTYRFRCTLHSGDFASGEAGRVVVTP